MSLIEKIDAEIFERGTEIISIKNKGMFISLDAIRKIIGDIDITERKESEPICKAKDTGCTGYKDGKCHSIENCSNKAEQPVITIGDKIRESNESLALELMQRSSCGYCMTDLTMRYSCKHLCTKYKRILDILNQPYTPTQSPTDTV
jgi:hypothetical protein